MSEKNANHLPSLGIIGLILTFLYVGSIFVYLNSGGRDGPLELTKLTLNELGDFLAGVFGPLAIFWLVLGFFQQSRELRLQVEELAQSVKQQRELVEVTRETLLHEAAVRSVDEKRRQESLQPNFKIEFDSDGRTIGTQRQTVLPTLEITNVGGTVFNVFAQFEFETHCWKSREVGTWANRGTESFRGNTVVEGNSFAAKLHITFKDADGNGGRKSYSICDGGLLSFEFSAREIT